LKKNIHPSEGIRNVSVGWNTVVVYAPARASPDRIAMGPLGAAVGSRVTLGVGVADALAGESVLGCGGAADVHPANDSINRTMRSDFTP
jgi:hypothetical protein